MYLFALVFIFLTIIGVFTEVLSLQNNRFIGKQIAGASTIETWHFAVVNAARYAIGGTPVFPSWGAGNAACTVGSTNGIPANFPLQAPLCIDASGNGTAALLDSLLVAPGPTPAVTTMLAPNFVARFQTVIFTSPSPGNTRLAVTFMNPGTNINDPIPQTGYTMSQLYRQLGRTGMDRSTYGYVVNGQLQPAATPIGTAGNYIIPNGPFPTPQLMSPNGPLQNGAIALSLRSNLNG